MITLKWHWRLIVFLLFDLVQLFVHFNMDYDRQIDVSAFREVGFPIYYEHVALMRTGRGIIIF